MTEAAPVDQATRERALAPDKSFIVKAPAGSGKTELLIRRYLRLLAVVDAPEEIVAITFTRKAAAEMRQRIIAALEAATGADVADVWKEQRRRQLAAAALARDEELGWRLMDNPARMRIQTIDSFCSELTQQMPLLSRLGGQPELTEDAEDLYREAAANALKQLDPDDPGDAGQAQWSQAVKTLLQHLDNNQPRVRDLLVVMLQRRDQWLRRVAGQPPDRNALEDALKHVAEETLKAARLAVQALPPDLAEELTQCIRFATENLAQSDGDEVIKALPGDALHDLPCWRRIVGLCLTNDGGWRKRVNIRQGFPPANAPGAGIESMAMKDRFQGVLNQLSDNDRLRELFLELRDLPPTAYRDEEWRALKALYSLLILADAHLRVLFAARNQVDFIGLSQAALQALGEEDDPTDLALYLDHRIRHILVDEYQDVSNNQQTLLERLTAGWSPGDGHSVFLVGDPMQSIYRFREAQVGVFLDAWERQLLGQQLPVEQASLKVNFRSDEALVDWVNETFAATLPQQPDPARGAVSFEPAIAQHPHQENNGVSVHPVPEQDGRIQEAERVLELIETIRRQEDGQEASIAILARNRSHLQTITSRLTQAGLRFRSLEMEQLQARPVIQDLLALTRALRHPADRVAWLALLRAPWCGLELADLLALVGDGKDRILWDCLQDADRLEALSPDGQARVARLRPALEQALLRQGENSLRRRTEAAWINLGGPATVESITDLGNAERFFELLDELDTGGDLRALDELARRVDGLYADADVLADDTLQVMTIHKAKGLEFDHVILPGLSRTGRNEDTKLLLWSENPYADTRQDMLLAPVKASHEDDSPIYTFIRKLEKQKQRYEEGRLLYVAATRARRQLHLLCIMKLDDEGELKPPQADALLAHLWPAVAGQFEAALTARPTPAEPEAAPPESDETQLRRLSLDWRLPAPPAAPQWAAVEARSGAGETAIEYLWAGRAIMHVGTVVHQCLETITTEGMARWDQVKISAGRSGYRESLYALGAPETELDQACDWVEQALTGILEDPRGRWLLTDHKEQQSECALSGIFHGDVVNIVIDRTFVDDDGVRWIVDYKTSRHESGDVEQFLDVQQERYREQLEKYAAIMSALDNRPIRLGLYFPLLRGWREWAFSGPNP